MTSDSGMLERGMPVRGEVWPTVATMEALCFDAGVAKNEFQVILEEVLAAMKKWGNFAKQARLSASKTKEIRERHRLIQSRII